MVFTWMNSQESIALVDEIKSAILGMHQRPGCVFTEPGLSRQFGFPRNYLRAAVTELKETGAITVVPRKGFKIGKYR